MYLYLPFLTDLTRSYFSSNLSACPKVMSCFSISPFFIFYPRKGVPSIPVGISIPAKERTVGTRSTKSTKADVLDPELNGDSFSHFLGT